MGNIFRSALLVSHFLVASLLPNSVDGKVDFTKHTIPLKEEERVVYIPSPLLYPEDIRNVASLVKERAQVRKIQENPRCYMMGFIMGIEGMTISYCDKDPVRSGWVDDSGYIRLYCNQGIYYDNGLDGIVDSCEPTQYQRMIGEEPTVNDRIYEWVMYRLSNASKEE